MARHPEGWKIYFDERYKTHYVRFTHAGRRTCKTTGEADPGQAAKVAARIYAEAISGRRENALGFASTDEIDEVASLWLADIESSLDHKTVDTYGLYVATHWQPTFQTVDRITEIAIEEYWRRRLRKVQRNTIKKELSALRGFLDWCRRKRFISDVPHFENPPPKAHGTRSKKQNPKPAPILITETQARKIIAKLPVTLPGRKSSKRYHVRARFEVAWETGLRPGTLDELRVPDNYKRGAKTLKIKNENDKARYGRELDLTPRARKALDKACPDEGLIFGVHDYRVPLARACTAAGTPQISPYDFRHSRTTQLLERSGNIPGVQYLVGHKHMATTARYVHASRRAAGEVLKSVQNSGGASQNQTKRDVRRRALTRQKR
jgi:integrase